MCINVYVPKSNNGKGEVFKGFCGLRKQTFVYISVCSVILVFWFFLTPHSTPSSYLTLYNRRMTRENTKVGILESKNEIGEMLNNRITWFGLLNPSVITHGKYIYVLLRRNVYRDRTNVRGYKGQDHSAALVLQQYDYDWNLIAENNLTFEEGQVANDPLCLEMWSVGVEDGRMFVWDNQLYTLGAVCHAIDEEKARIDQYVISIPSDVNQVNTLPKSVELLEPDTNTVPNEKGTYNHHKDWLMEKNWLPFEENGVLYVVYSIAPRFCVKQLDLQNKKLMDPRCYHLPIEPGQTLRGSAGIIDIEYGEIKYKAVLSHWRKDENYIQYIILFHPKSFKPLTISRGFTFDCMNEFTLTDASLADCGIVFVTTMTRLSEDKILFGFGWQDRVASITTVSEQQILDLLPTPASKRNLQQFRAPDRKTKGLDLSSRKRMQKWIKGFSHHPHPNRLFSQEQKK